MVAIVAARTVMRAGARTIPTGTPRITPSPAPSPIVGIAPVVGRIIAIVRIAPIERAPTPAVAPPERVIVNINVDLRVGVIFNQDLVARATDNFRVIEPLDTAGIGEVVILGRVKCGRIERGDRTDISTVVFIDVAGRARIEIVGIGRSVVTGLARSFIVVTAAVTGADSRSDSRLGCLATLFGSVKVVVVVTLRSHSRHAKRTHKN